jgi:serine protease AprX
MPTSSDRPLFPIPGALVDLVLLGPMDDRRQLQDSPILGDVWLAYAANPAGSQDLLITPHKTATAARVARVLSEHLTRIRIDHKTERAQIAYVQGLVAARLYLGEMLRVIVPLTLWWETRDIPKKLAEGYDPEKLGERLGLLFRSLRPDQRRADPMGAADEAFSALDRYLALAGLLLWASDAAPETWPNPAPPASEEVLELALAHLDQIVAALMGLYTQIASDDSGAAPESLIFQVSLNRRVSTAIERSVPAVKADAARTLFRVETKKITWAVLDSGIDQNHPAFCDDGESRKTRVRKTFDFTRVREILCSDNDQLSSDELKQLLRGVDMTETEARARLDQLKTDIMAERSTNWDVVEELLTLTTPPKPTSPHGTHVAGIIGARAPEKGGDWADGMCPDIQLYDFRVLAKTVEDTEFAVIAALQYIRYVNERHSYITIHGANLSLSIPHNVRNYACGRTPVCNECQRLVESGVVVVAAAGNRGYQRFETKEGLFENYAAFSITDPGNADDVITVGATHGNWPHTYGVSFFSSRGPTGDGRLKPDLVAPGERIQSPVPGGYADAESGTSMAAPHVSGAAAMLMARYAELIGNPRRLKRILCDSATDLGRERSFQGHGMLDVLRAFQSI